MTETATVTTTKPAEPPSPCPKCGGERVWVTACAAKRKRVPRCRPCHAALERAHVRKKASRLKACDQCGVKLPPGGTCSVCAMKRNGRLAFDRLQEERGAEYLACLRAALSEENLDRLGATLYKSQKASQRTGKRSVTMMPAPSLVFSGLLPALDTRLVALGRETDVKLCKAVAARPRLEQAGFLERYLRDAAEAERWSRLPAWKRPMLAGNDQDRRLWELFTVARLMMETYNEVGLHSERFPIQSQTSLLKRLVGTLRYVTDRDKLFTVFSQYAVAREAGLDAVGDTVTPPWES